MAKNKQYRKAHKTARRTKDLDQILTDVEKEKVGKPAAQLDQDLPGMGEHYCVECARYFITPIAIEDHRKSKEHKKRVKALKEPIHSQEVANFAAGLRTQKKNTPSKMTA